MRIKNFFIAVLFFVMMVCESSCDYVNYQQGKVLYETNCAVCHMTDGTGVAQLYPALNNISESKVSLEDVPCIIKNGLQREGSVIQMAALEHLSEVEINNIVNYLSNDMNGFKTEITIQQTKDLLRECK